MKIVIAIDSFKGSLSSIEAGHAVEEGIKCVIPQSETVVKPLADGGEGTVEALTLGLGGELQRIEVEGPLRNKVSAVYGLFSDTKTAVMEMAQASGITLIESAKRNPLYTSTYGVGQMILDAVKKGARNFIVGIGGSATNDGGAGMLQALGFSFLDKNDAQIDRGCLALEDLCSIKTDKVPKEIFECTFNIACDVNNPLCGELGCSAVYGPQKGADKDMIIRMDKILSDYAALAENTMNKPGASLEPGAGAAGGLGFAFKVFLNASLKSGVSLILSMTKLEDCIKDADLVITGEGRLDAQTMMGKAPSGVAALAKKYGIKVIAFSGCVTEDANECNEKGIDAFFPCLRTVCTLDDALNKNNAFKNLKNTATQVFRLINLLRQE